jgi:hypothetical protein
MNDKETYLGDGLYASQHGEMVKLRAPNPIKGDQIIYLEPSVIAALIDYMVNKKILSFEKMVVGGENEQE